MSEHPLSEQSDSRERPEVWVRFGIGAEVPAIPLPMPLLTRWLCDHRWTPHVHLPQGWHSHLDWDCWRCGATYENASAPNDGPWPRRSAIAKLIRSRRS